MMPETEKTLPSCFIWCQTSAIFFIINPQCNYVFPVWSSVEISFFMQPILAVWQQGSFHSPAFASTRVKSQFKWYNETCSYWFFSKYAHSEILRQIMCSSALTGFNPSLVLYYFCGQYLLLLFLAPPPFLSGLTLSLIPSSNRVCGYKDELQQPVNDVPGRGEQSRLQWGRHQALHAASPGWPGLLQHPEGHRLCQDDTWLQVNTKHNITLIFCKNCVQVLKYMWIMQYCLVLHHICPSGLLISEYP